MFGLTIINWWPVILTKYKVFKKISVWGDIVAYKLEKFGDYRERRNFSKTKNVLELNDLLEIQKKSYDLFLNEGIKEIFSYLFHVESFTDNISLVFGDYYFNSQR